MVSRREQFRYDKWLDSLKEPEYELMGKVISDVVAKEKQQAYGNGIVSGAMIVLVAVVVMMVIVVVI
jgi:hypothetical protein